MPKNLDGATGARRPLHPPISTGGRATPRTPLERFRDVGTAQRCDTGATSTSEGRPVTQDLDQVLELVGLFAVLTVLFPVFMAWLEDSMTATEKNQGPRLPRFAQRLQTFRRRRRR